MKPLDMATAPQDVKGQFQYLRESALSLLESVPPKDEKQAAKTVLHVMARYQDVIQKLAMQSDAISPQDTFEISFCGTVIITLLRTMSQNPLYGTDALKLQLRENMDAVLATAKYAGDWEG